MTPSNMSIYVSAVESLNGHQLVTKSLDMANVPGSQLLWLKCDICMHMLVLDEYVYSQNRRIALMQPHQEVTADLMCVCVCLCVHAI